MFERQRTPLWGFLALIWLAFGLRLYQLNGQSLWWDELSTVVRTAVPLDEMFANLLTIRNHMPLYFLLMRLWADIGRSEFIMRYFSLLCGVLCLPLIYQVGRFTGGKRTGLLAALLLAISPFHIWYSQEARMYTFLLFFVLLAHWFLLRTFYYNTLYNWLGYMLAMLIALYTHYMAALILIVHYTFFAWHYRRLRTHFRHWLVAAGSVGFLFGLWLGYMILTGGFRDAPIGWIPAATWLDPLLTWLAFTVGPSIDPAQAVVFLPLLLLAVGIGVCLGRYGRLPVTHPKAPVEEDIRPYLFARLLLLWLTLPPLLLLLISLELPIPEKRSIYMDRYLIITLPAFLLLAAWGFTLLLAQKRGRWFVGLAFGGIFLVTAVSLNNMYHNPFYARVDWRTAMAQLAASWQEHDKLIVEPSQILPLAYYANQTSEDQLVLASVAEMNPGLFAEARRIWVIETYENINQHGFPQQRQQQMEQHQSAYKLWLMAHFPVTGK